MKIGILISLLFVFLLFPTIASAHSNIASGISLTDSSGNWYTLNDLNYATDNNISTRLSGSLYYNSPWFKRQGWVKLTLPALQYVYYMNLSYGYGSSRSGVHFYIIKYNGVTYPVIYDNFATSQAITWLNISINDNVSYLELRFEIPATDPTNGNVDYYELQAWGNIVPTTPQIAFPVNNSRHYNNSVNFTWNQSTDTDDVLVNYDFWLSSQSDFSNMVNRTNFTNNWTGDIAMTDGVTYYGKVRSFDGHDYSNWSQTVQFTENSVPSVPQILFPSNSSRQSNFVINFTWNQSTDADSDSLTYDFWLSSQSDFSNTVNRTNFTNNWTGGIVTVNGVTYYVKVRSYDGYEYSNWSTSVVFVNDNISFVFSQKSISESQIYQSSQSTKISVNVTDPDGNITSVLAGITYAGNETNYSMVKNGNFWEYPFSSSVAGAYTVTKFYATDNEGGMNSSASSLAFTVVPVSAGGGGSPGGSSGLLDAVTNVTKVVNYKNVPYNVNTFGQDPGGRMILFIVILFGGFYFIIGMKRQSKVSYLIIGFIMMVVPLIILGYLGG